MGAGLNVPDWAHTAFQTFGFVEHFDHFITADRWTVTATDSGGVTVLDQVGGVAQLDASDATVADNDETYLLTSNEIFKFLAEKPIYGGFSINFTEANTDDANVACGFANAVAANHLQDDGAGPPADYSGAVFYKVDGGTKWIFETSKGTTQTTNTTDVTAGGGTAQILEIFIESYSSTQLKAYPKIDGTHCRDNTTGDPISHLITVASATEMNAWVGVKNGGANEEKVDVDTAVCLQKI